MFKKIIFVVFIISHQNVTPRLSVRASQRHTQTMPSIYVM